MSLPGAFKAQKKDGTIYYRSSITYKNKHISLGSFKTEEEASGAYLEALAVTGSSQDNNMSASSAVSSIYKCTLDNYHTYCQILSFDKYISLLNFRDNGIYIKTPIYMGKTHFNYYISANEILKFDVDDLFYFSNHSIMKRQGYLFVADYGMQINILSRYGIRSHAVKNRDYEFINGDDHDYRYHNIRIINRYYGVEAIKKNGRIPFPHPYQWKLYNRKIQLRKRSCHSLQQGCGNASRQRLYYRISGKLYRGYICNRICQALQ